MCPVTQPQLRELYLSYCFQMASSAELKEHFALLLFFHLEIIVYIM